MYKSKPTSKSLIFPLILLLLLLLTSKSLSSENENEDVDDLEDIEELIAIDETGENQESNKLEKQSEVLSKAQRLVVELHSDNTKTIVETNEYVLVLGYAPWCSRSSELMPRFAEAANVLKGKILLAKIDAERYPKAASDLQIKGFPTLLLFINGTSHAYTGGFSSEEIVIWARKKTGAPVIRINSVAEAHQFLKEHTMYVVGLFDKFEGHDYEEFVKAAASDNEIQFIVTSRTEVANVLYPVVNLTKPSLGLVKNEPEHYTSFDGDFISDKILHFVENNKFPLVTIMTELNSAKVYSSPIKLQVYVFADADDLSKLLEPVRDIAKTFRSQVMFIAVDIEDDNLAKPFLTLFGLEDSKDTIVIAFDFNSNAKYLLELDLTSTNIQDFCSALVRGTLTAFYKSQPIPENKNLSIQTVVGKTFDDLVLNSPSNIVLEVHTPWCITCETTSKHVERLMNHFKGLDNLVFARIDASANEHPKLQVEDYPSLLFYPAKDKSNPIKLPTRSKLKELAAVINEKLKTRDFAAKDEL